ANPASPRPRHRLLSSLTSSSTISRYDPFIAATFLERGEGLLHVEEDPLIGQRRLVRAHDLDLALDGDLRALRTGFHRDDPLTGMHFDAGRNRRDKAQFVRAVVDHIAVAGDLPA